MFFKKKKIIAVCALMIVGFIITCFAIGYKIPQRDKHPDWTTLKGNTDKKYFLKQVTYVADRVKIADDRIVLYNTDFDRSTCVVNDAGNVLYTFKKEDGEILIDKAHKRLIQQKEYRASNGKTDSTKYLAFNVETFESKPLKIKIKPLIETYEKYKQRMNITLEYSTEKQEEFHVKDSVCTAQYKASQNTYVAFLKSLHPVVEMTESYPSESVALYSDSAGIVYNIWREKNDNDYPYKYSGDFTSDYIYSLDKLSETWNSAPDLTYYPSWNPNFAVAEPSTITGNEFNFDLGLNFNPAGGSGHPMRMYFEQNYLNYYTIKMKEGIFHFKMFDNIHIIYVEQDLESFEQLNVPQKASDTLSFLFDKHLYQLYLR